MKSRFHKFSILAAAVLGALSAGSAFAVASYGNLDAAKFSATEGGVDCRDGVYAGTACAVQNGDFTIDRSNGIEVGLRAKNRLDFSLIDGSNGVYHAPPGKSSPSRAMWNYEFSVNTQQGGGSLTLNDVSVFVRVDSNASAGVTFGNWLNVFTNWGDNAYANGTAVRVGAGPAQPGEFGVQQSVNPLFGNSGFLPGFNPFGPGTYEIELAVFQLGTDPNAGFTSGNRLAGTDITVQVPEPGTLALMGLSLAGMAVVRRRKISAS